MENNCSIFQSVCNDNIQYYRFRLKNSLDPDEFIDISTQIESVEYLESVVLRILRNTMELKFITKILQFLDQDQLTYEDSKYILLRMSHHDSMLKLLYEVHQDTGNVELIIESLCIRKGIRIRSKIQSIHDKYDPLALQIEFLNFGCNSKKTSVIKYFVLLAVRAICENLPYFVTSKNVVYHDENKESATIKVLVPQKLWNANASDNVGWKTEVLDVVNRIINTRSNSDLSLEDKDALSTIQIVPTSFRHLMKHLQENRGSFNESNISFDICSNNKIDVFSEMTI